MITEIKQDKTTEGKEIKSKRKVQKDKLLSTQMLCVPINILGVKKVSGDEQGSVKSN